MRLSPLRHPLAVLRTTIGLTQKEMADLVQRSTRTIQAVELGQLPLSEDLAKAIAEATGVDQGWLLENNPKTPPRKGITAMGMGTGTGQFGKPEFEFHRAFLESPVASDSEVEAARQAGLKSKTTSKQLVPLSLPVMKRLMLGRKKSLMQAADQALLAEVKNVLNQTIISESCDLIRWRIRQCLKSLEADFKLHHAKVSAQTVKPAKKS